MTKEVQIFTVRTANGGFVGTFRAMTAQQAIKRAVNGLAETAQTFRRCPRADPLAYGAQLGATIPRRGQLLALPDPLDCAPNPRPVGLARGAAGRVGRVALGGGAEYSVVAPHRLPHHRHIPRVRIPRPAEQPGIDPFVRSCRRYASQQRRTISLVPRRQAGVVAVVHPAICRRGRPVLRLARRGKVRPVRTKSRPHRPGH